MKRLIIAALLGGVAAAPAQAGLFIELTGSSITYLMQDDYTSTPLSASTISVSGYCGDPSHCDFKRTDGGFSLYAGSYHASGINLYFNFDETLDNMFDGLWHDGYGEGEFAGGYIAPGYTYTYGFLNSARLTVDDYWVPGYEYPTYSLGVRYGVPEPATWAMMIGGFALAGAAFRRRKKAVGFGPSMR